MTPEDCQIFEGITGRPPHPLERKEGPRATLESPFPAWPPRPPYPITLADQSIPF